MSDLRCRFIWSCVFLLIVGGQLSFGEVGITTTDRFQLVLTADDEPLVGVDIISPSGSLLPGQRDAAGPFSFALAQSETQATYANLGITTVLNGDRASLPTRWNPTGVPDVIWSYGIGPLPSPYETLFGPPNFVSDPDITVSLNEQNRFVLSGAGEQLVGIRFDSPSGSLTPGPEGNAGPFDVAYSNNANQLAYGQISGEQPVTLDGSLTLPGGWNEAGFKDVTYHYNQVGPVHSGTLQLEIDAPERERLNVSLNDDYQFVIHGTGQQISDVSFSSRSGSLMPSATSDPFESLTSNSPVRIAYSSETPLIVDGEITLGAAWNRNLGFQDVEFSYFDFGAEISAPLVSSVYGTQIVRDSLGMRINHESLAVEIFGNGQELRTLQIDSNSGSLVHDATQTGPFDSIVRSSNRRVEFASDGFLTIDGTLTLPVEFDRSGNPDLTYRYEQVGLGGRQGPFRAVFSPDLVPIRAWIDIAGFFNVQGSGHDVAALDFRSEGGALIPGESPAPFESFESNSANHVRMLGNVELDGRLRLDLQWNEQTATDVELRYNLQDSDLEFGPHAIAYPSPNVITVLAAPFLSDRISLVGEGHLITAVELTSETGSLLPLEIDENSPFDIVEALTENRILLRSTSGVMIRNELLPATWDPNGEADIRVTFESAGARAITSRIIYTGNDVVPEPATSLLLLSLLPVLGATRCQRPTILASRG